MLHRVALGTLLCSIGLMTGWGFSRRFLVRNIRMPNAVEPPNREGQALPVAQRWTGWSLVSSREWETDPSPDTPSHSGRGWLDWISPKGDTTEGKVSKLSAILEWIPLFLPRPDIMGGSDVPWLREYVGSRIIYHYMDGFKDVTSRVWGWSFNLIMVGPVK